MNKLGRTFWKYFLQKRIKTLPKIEERNKFGRMAASVAPKEGDEVGYRVFSVACFVGFAVVLAIMCFPVVVILNVLFAGLISIWRVAYSIIIAVSLSGVFIGALSGVIYESRYRLWPYAAIRFVVLIIVTVGSYYLLTAFPYLLRYVTVVFVVTSGLSLLLLIFADFAGGKEQNASNIL